MVDQKKSQNREGNPFLATKLFIPKAHDKLIVRPDLLGKLNAYDNHKMTLVSAPAGFGKTTILTQWIAQCNHPVAWLSLDEKDNDPYSFLRYFIAALQTVDSKVGAAAANGLQTVQKQSLTAVLIPLLNDIAEREYRLCLVLDDYHCIESPEVHEILRYIFQHMPPQMHLILSTRVDPPLPLAKMRARKTLAEIRIDELCFKRQDIGHFFHEIIGLPLSHKELSVLKQRTEGWAAGLQLVAISLLGSEDTQGFIEAFAGDNRFIADYLMEEVLQKQNEGTSKFLLRTSVLGQLSADLCDHILETEDSQSTLEDLEHQNLFIIPLDNKRKWFRYHHLFRDLLYQRLKKEDNALISELLVKASRWHEKSGYKDSAVDYAIAAEDFTYAAKLLEQISAQYWSYDQRTKLTIWLEKIPQEYIHEYPELCLLFAWVLLDDNRREEAIENLIIVEQFIGGLQGREIEGAVIHEKFDIQEIRGKMFVLRALVETGSGDFPRIIEFAENGLEHLPLGSHSWRANGLLALGIAYSLKGELDSAVGSYIQSMKLSKTAGNLDLYFRAGIWLVARLTYAAQLDQAISICEEMFDVIKKDNLEHSPFATGVYLSWGNIMYERNRLEEAFRYIKRDFEKIEAALDISHKAWCYCCMMKILSAQNDMAGVNFVIEKLERMEAAFELPYSFSLLTGSWKAKMWLLQGENDKVQRWFLDKKLTLSDEIEAYRDLGHIILARSLFAENRIVEVRDLLRKLIRGGEKLGRSLLLIEALLVYAQVVQVDGDSAEAGAAVGRALRLAEKGKCVRVFLNEGQPVARLIEQLLDEKEDVPRSFAQQLLAEFKISEITESEMQQEPALLSERELEILRFIAAGLSNKKIMEKLYISLSTVKTHLRNIYVKLDAHSRTEAVAKALELNLL